MQNFKRAFNKFPLISFKFEKEGSKIIFNSKNQDDWIDSYFAYKNSEKNIDIFLNSLKDQDFKDFYLLIADGSSEDKTLDIIKKYNFKSTIISNSDSSAEDGINKCMRKVETIFLSFEFWRHARWKKLLIFINSRIKKRSDIAFPNFGSILNNVQKVIIQKDDFTNLIYHNASPDIGWMAKSSVLKEGLFPENYKLASAYFFLLNLYKKGYSFKRNTNVFYFFRIGGNSYKNAILAYTEQKEISLKFGSNKFLVYMILYKNLIKFFIKHKLLKFWNKV